MDNYQKEIREECQQEYIWTTIKKKRWTYLDHVLRTTSERPPNAALNWNPSGKRGRPKETLKRIVLREGKVANVEKLDQMTAVARDRER